MRIPKIRTEISDLLDIIPVDDTEYVVRECELIHTKRRFEFSPVYNCLCIVLVGSEGSAVGYHLIPIDHEREEKIVEICDTIVKYMRKILNQTVIRIGLNSYNSIPGEGYFGIVQDTLNSVFPEITIEYFRSHIFGYDPTADQFLEIEKLAENISRILKLQYTEQ